MRLSRLAVPAASVLALVVMVSPVSAGETHRVVVERFRFVPESLSIVAGDSIEFVNRDLAPHTATDRHRTWDTGLLRRGGSVTVQFADPGSFDYFCVYHPRMTARITVAPN